MNIAKMLREGIKLVALFDAVALVVWSMPESTPHSPTHSSLSTITANQ